MKTDERDGAMERAKRLLVYTALTTWGILQPIAQEMRPTPSTYVHDAIQYMMRHDYLPSRRNV